MYEHYRGELSENIFNVARGLKNIEKIEDLKLVGQDLEIVLSTLYEWLRHLEKAAAKK